MNYLDAIKYPKTFHFDFSGSLQNDDRRLETFDFFRDRNIVVTEKLDGENATIYSNYYHPRSVIDDGHESRNWLKGFIPTFQYKMNSNWRICGENLYAEHSIKYDNLDTFFYVFNVFSNDPNFCLHWDQTESICKILNLKTVPVLYKGKFNYDKIKDIYYSLDFKKQEGIVVRVEDAFAFEDFNKFVAKAVRPKHVATDDHWKKTWKPNKLKK